MCVGVCNGHGDAVQVAPGRMRDVGHKADEVGRTHELLKDRAVRLLNDIGMGHVAPQHSHPEAHLGEHEEALAVKIGERHRFV